MLTGSNPQQKKLTRNQPSVKGSGMRIIPESNETKVQAEMIIEPGSVQWDEGENAELGHFKHVEPQTISQV